MSSLGLSRWEDDDDDDGEEEEGGLVSVVSKKRPRRDDDDDGTLLHTIFSLIITFRCDGWYEIPVIPLIRTLYRLVTHQIWYTRSVFREVKRCCTV